MTPLQVVRVERGYSLRALAEKIGCSYNAIHTWERGRCRPRAETARRLEKELGLPLSVLLPERPGPSRKLLQRNGLNDQGHRFSWSGGLVNPVESAERTERGVTSE